MKNCKEQYVANSFGVGFHMCPNRATMPSGYCRTHDPDCIAERAAKRPPSRFERECKARDDARKAEIAKETELAELRAYRERTEAALQAWCDDLTAFLEEDADEHVHLFTRSEIEDLKEAGLWRDPPQAEVQCRRLLDIIDHEKEPC